MIYVDPSEVRKGTRFPKELEIVELPGLESATGADLLISCRPGKLEDVRNLDILPVRLGLEMHCRSGILIQRKYRGDFPNSIPNLSEYQVRLQKWGSCGGIWLIAIGVYFDENGILIAGGRPSGMSFESVMGSIWKWRFRGGHVEFLDSNEEFVVWVQTAHKHLTEITKEPEKLVHMENTSPMTPDQGRFVPESVLQKLVPTLDNWLTSGRLFPPGIGFEKRLALAESLAEDELPITAYNAILRATSGQVKIKGWGPKTHEACFDWLLPFMEDEKR